MNRSTDTKPRDRGIILASASTARARLIEAAGVVARICPAQVDEKASRATLDADLPAPLAATEVACFLARAKAREVSRRFPGRVIIGADQVLECDGEIFEKPDDLAQARAQLVALRGRRHHLHSAVVLARSGAVLWHHVDSAALEMRDFSDQFMEDYLKRAGDDVCASVGAYQIENLGVQLFGQITGDSFTIQGLPLLPLLAELRRQGVLAR